MRIVVLLLSLCTMSATTTAFLTTYPGGVASPPKSLVGRWEHTFPKGVWVWTIQPNGTFTLTSKGKTFANGQYRVQNGIYQMNDANCNVNYQGRYRFVFLRRTPCASQSLRIPVRHVGQVLTARAGNAWLMPNRQIISTFSDQGFNGHCLFELAEEALEKARHSFAFSELTAER